MSEKQTRPTFSGKKLLSITANSGCMDENLGGYMDSDNSFYGILPLHCYIKSLQETERWLAKVEAEIRGDEFPRKKKDYTPQYDDGY